MDDTFELNRLEYNILKYLYDNGCIDHYHSMTITELLDNNERLGARMTIWKKLNKLVKAKYVKKGITDNHADTFYLLNKSLKIIEGRESGTSTQQIRNYNSIPCDSGSIQDKLADIIARGLMLKSVAVNAGLSESELSRFKNGVDSLKDSDVRLLAEYLNAVVIPQWNTVMLEKKLMTMRERILASKNKQNEEKPKRRRSNVSLDLLNELES